MGGGLGVGEHRIGGVGMGFLGTIHRPVATTLAVSLLTVMRLIHLNVPINAHTT